ncbi:MAG: TolB family protein [Actinomycetota bacterium]
MGPNGGDVRQLTSSNVIEEEPEWSPDGRWITFDASAMSPDAAHFHTDIWVMRSNGSHATQLTHGGFDVEPVFSPDGSRIAFGRITKPADDPTLQREAIDVMHVGGTHVRRVVAPSDVEHPGWSPNGRWISFNIVPEDPRGAVVAVHPDGTGHHVIRHSNARMRFFNAVWSPEGQALLAGCHDVIANIDQLCEMHADGSDVDVVVDGMPAGVNFPSWGVHAPAL